MASQLKLEEFRQQRSISSLEDFRLSPSNQSFSGQDLLESEAYDKGYGAGWDDSAKAEAQSQTRIGLELASNLQDLGFTFYEARTQVLQSLDGFLSELIDKLLPRVISESLGHLIIQELKPMAEDLTDLPVQIVISPLARDAIEPIVSASTSIPFELFDEPSLGLGQVQLRVSGKEKHIDMNGALDRISAALGAMQSTGNEVLKHG